MKPNRVVAILYAMNLILLIGIIWCLMWLNALSNEIRILKYPHVHLNSYDSEIRALANDVYILQSVAGYNEHILRQLVPQMWPQDWKAKMIYDDSDN